MNVNNVWTDKDFDVMGWHDSTIHAILFPTDTDDLIFDIDYIFKWELQPSGFYKFWVSPCHLKFHGVYNIVFELEFQNNVGLYIEDINRANPRISPNGMCEFWDYIIETDRGTIRFEAVSFTQEVLVQPILGSQRLDRV